MLWTGPGVILDVLVSCVVDRAGSYPGCVGELCCGPGRELSWMCWRVVLWTRPGVILDVLVSCVVWTRPGVILDVLVSCVVDQAGSYPGCVGGLCCEPGRELSWMCW